MWTFGCISDSEGDAKKEEVRAPEACRGNRNPDKPSEETTVAPLGRGRRMVRTRRRLALD